MMREACLGPELREPSHGFWLNTVLSQSYQSKQLKQAIASLQGILSLEWSGTLG